jgi:hypothetical protein
MNNLNLSPMAHAYAIVFTSLFCLFVILAILNGIIRSNKNHQDYLKLLNFRRMIDANKNLPEGYREIKAPELSALDWLIDYYEEKGSTRPKELLDFMLDAQKYERMYHVEQFRYAAFLYNWVYYKNITNF